MKLISLFSFLFFFYVQGAFSASEVTEREQSAGGVIGFYVSKSLEYEVAPMSRVSTTVKSKLNSDLLFSTNMNYAHDHSDDYPEIYSGFSDLTLSVLWLAKEKSLFSYGLSLQLPLSEASQLNSLYSSLSAEISGDYKLGTSIFWVSSSHGIELSAYKFETGDKHGLSYNSPFSFYNSISISTLYKGVYHTSLGYNIALNYLFSDETSVLQSIYLSESIRLDQKIYLSLGVNWRDQLISHNDLIEPFNSAVNVGLSVLF